MACTVTGMHARSGCILRRFGISSAGHSNKDLGFDDDIFPMAACMDPTYAFHWLNDLPSTQQDKEEIRQHIIGDSYNFFALKKIFIQIFSRWCYLCHKDRVE